MIQKTCNKCLIIKPLEEFYKNQSHKTDKKRSICKLCDYKNCKNYRIMQPEKYKKIHTEKRRKKIKFYRKMAKISARKRRITHPWEQHFYMAKNRCENSNRKSFSVYGGRGIKFFLTKEEIKIIWLRDKAEKLKRPSIDRIDPDSHYMFGNCRFLELRENSSRHRITEEFRKRMSVLMKKRWAEKMQKIL